ncbi:MAG: prepilin-type N-terminal cleavage/methylation domain-containing protein, partial [Bacilli bacterium]
MKQKGFTLVELLAVIVILAIILAVAIPGIGAIINSSKVSSYNSQMNLIKKAASLYMAKYSNGTTISVRLDDLIEAGFIKDNVV